MTPSTQLDSNTIAYMILDALADDETQRLYRHHEGSECMLDGSPEGVMYAALMGVTSLDRFNLVIARLEDLGYVYRSSLNKHLIRISGLGREVIENLRSQTKESKP
jgi:hypothetical protein